MDILDILLDILLKPPQPLMGLFLNLDPGWLNRPLLIMYSGFILLLAVFKQEHFKLKIYDFNHIYS